MSETAGVWGSVPPADRSVVDSAEEEDVMNWWRFSAGVVALVAMVLVIHVACSAGGSEGTRTPLDDTPRNPEPIEVVAVDGMATLTVPAGSAPAGYTFTITDITESADLVSVGPVYHIQPSGTQFATPVTLTVKLPFDPEDIWVDLRGEDFSLARLAGDRWIPLETTYDPVSQTLSAQITHLSGYGIAPNHTPVNYQVDDHHPYWLWADHWRGHVWTQKIASEGSYSPQFPHLYETVISFFGEEEPVMPTSPTRVIFSWPQTDPHRGSIYWQGSLGVRGSAAYSKSQNPSPDYSCGYPTVSIIQNLEAPNRSDGFGEFELDPRRKLTIELAASLSGGRYFVTAFAADDAYLPGWIRVQCLDEHATILADQEHPIEVHWGVNTDPHGNSLPSSRQFLTDQQTRPPVPPVTMDFDQWTFAPEYDRPEWSAEFLAHLQSRDYHVKRTFWEEIDQKCDAGDLSGISCKAATKTLSKYDETIASWSDDCERIQHLMLEEGAKPLLRNSRVYDAYIVAGPVPFCKFVHRLLLSYIPIMPAGSITQFYQRLPYELQKLYPIAALDALFGVSMLP